MVLLNLYGTVFYSTTWVIRTMFVLYKVIERSKDGTVSFIPVEVTWSAARQARGGLTWRQIVIKKKKPRFWNDFWNKVAFGNIFDDAITTNLFGIIDVYFNRNYSTWLVPTYIGR